MRHYIIDLFQIFLFSVFISSDSIIKVQIIKIRELSYLLFSGNRLYASRFSDFLPSNSTKISSRGISLGNPDLGSAHLCNSTLRGIVLKKQIFGFSTYLL